MTPVAKEVLHRRTTLLGLWCAATVLMVPSNLSKEVVMPVSIVATGRVVEAPIQLLGEDVWSAFVLDPFPGSPGARLAHSCEVVCRRQNLPSSNVRAVACGDAVEVTGELLMERVSGPIEDDLSAVRVWIRAATVSLAR
jgi:hypothetical protein